MRRRPWWWRLRWLARRAKIELRQRAVDVADWVRPPQLLEGGRRVWRWQRPPHFVVVINHEPEDYGDTPPPDPASWSRWAVVQHRLLAEVERLRVWLRVGRSPVERFYAALDEAERRDR